MSYDVELVDAVTGNTLELDEPHHMRGGTYCLGGTTEAWLNITYNYSKHFYRLFPERPWRAGIDHESDQGKPVGGIRYIYGLTGAQSMQVLESVIERLGDDVDPDYWAGTEGNAKRALRQLLELAKMRPDGVWRGD